MGEMTTAKTILLGAALACSLSICSLPAYGQSSPAPHPRRAQASSVGLGGFRPVSVTFVSLRQGWALGTVPCKATGACLALATTRDAGRTWSGGHLPVRLVAAADRPVTNGLPAGSAGYIRLPAVLYGSYGLSVRFANTADGWIWGGLPASAGTVRAELWSTHNGGTTWRQLSVLPGSLAQYDASVLDLEAAGGSAYLMAPNNHDGVTIESTPISSDAWHVDKAPTMYQPAGGSQLEGALVLQDGAGWALAGNDRGVSGSAKLVSPKSGTWAPWAGPCSKVGGSFVVPAAPTPSDLVTACQMGGFASSLSKFAPAGAKLGSWWLYLSGDGGRTWTAGPQLGTEPYVFGGLISSPRPGAVLLTHGFVGGNPPAQLRASFDGGRTWATAYKGEFFYLGFTSPRQGVGILQTSASSKAMTEMVMTFDGGRHWSPVHFLALSRAPAATAARSATGSKAGSQAQVSVQARFVTPASYRAQPERTAAVTYDPASVPVGSRILVTQSANQWGGMNVQVGVVRRLNPGW